MTTVREHYSGTATTTVLTGSSSVDVLSFSPQPNSEYFYIWSASVRPSQTGSDFVVNVYPKKSTGVSDFDGRVSIFTVGGSVDIRYPMGGVGLIQFDSDPPSSNTFNMTFLGPFNTNVFITVLIIRKRDHDYFFEQSPIEATTTSTSLTPFMSGSFPSDLGSQYLKVVSVSKGYSGDSSGIFCTHDFNYNASSLMTTSFTPSKDTDRVPSLHFHTVGTTTESGQTFSFSHSTNNSALTTTSKFGRVAFIKINYSDFSKTNYNKDLLSQANTSLTTVIGTSDLDETFLPGVILSSVTTSSRVNIPARALTRIKDSTIFSNSDFYIPSPHDYGGGGAPPYSPYDYSHIQYFGSGFPVEDVIRIEGATFTISQRVYFYNRSITYVSLGEIENGSLAAVNGIITKNP